MAEVMGTSFGVLGPVIARNEAGRPIDLKGPRHRAVLARLLVARGRVVPVHVIIEDLWADPPAGAKGAVQTFVSALRRALEPQRAARSSARLLVTEGPGYALRADADSVDAWRFEDAVARAMTAAPRQASAVLAESLGWWRGPAYAEFADEPWARAERARLEELRLSAVERLARARVDLGLADAAVPDLDAHVAEHPWREEAWRLLALALYRAGRQGDALAALRQARELLADELGIDPGPELRALETDILQHAEHLGAGRGAAGRVWEQAAAAYDRTVAAGSKARLESTVGLLRSLALSGGGGLEAARQQRLGTITAAEQLNDPELTARVIGSYDVPGIWTRSDDPEQAALIVAAAERTLARLPADAPETTRARLLVTIALETRGTRTERGSRAARAAEEIARRLDDPALLASALSGVFMHTFQRTGLASRRDAIGRELIDVSTRHGLVTFEILGHLIRMQALGAFGDFDSADQHAAAAEVLAERHEAPLVTVFTTWYRAMRAAATGASVAVAEAGYQRAAELLHGSGMPGLERGILALALLCLRVSRGQAVALDADADFGPYEPWARPHLLLANNRSEAAAAALRRIPDPPPDLLLEALWCLTARAAVMVGDRAMMTRARIELSTAANEIAGAGSGVLSAGPVAAYLGELTAALDARP
ncbi:AfsR/SARP family transcriptional regulator [Nocardia goodfellowii]|uniref:DNA-binding SARP family transcriptional activator n=1 Tax=Nocardia goodfellowii TaxID=882446 RepID=A0ABS4QNG2_9NOCA|nr:BTAD domain-containing putative transcriptional regulator [Nocardia goodfellowii]MBP2193247.1 DNA-binding SARP family transcriptional activator [Nocardia goodfellowii]